VVAMCLLTEMTWIDGIISNSNDLRRRSTK
jgi:hypothetical protein